MTKREEREHLFRLLFFKDFYPDEELCEQKQFYVEKQQNTTPEALSNVTEKFDKIVEKTEEIDKEISEKLTGWGKGRIGKTELTILRIAVYEINYDDSVPAKVAINEAVELAKIYGGEASPSFVNGVLAKVVKEEEQ